MYGYIYKTTNLINNKVYIGKKESSSYVPSYLGSGKLIRKAIAKYGVENFKNEIVDVASNKEELNQKERYYISLYKEQYKNSCYNIATGGDGGNVIEHWTGDDREAFSEKMKAINKERCSTPEFRKSTSERTKSLWLDDTYRANITSKINKIWSDEEKREKQRQMITKYYSNADIRAQHAQYTKQRWEIPNAREVFNEQMKTVWTKEKRVKHSEIVKNATTETTLQKRSVNAKKMWESEEHRRNISEKIRSARLSEEINKGAEARKTKVLMQFNDEEMLFDSRVSFENYCLERFGFAFSNKTYKKLLETGEPFKSYYKKQAHMNGIRLYNV